MFDPSFFELIIICIVALLVLGPDRLPGAIKTLGLWIGRLRRSFNNIKREIEQEVGADEIRRQLRNEAIMEKFNNTKNQVTESIESIKSETESIKEDLNLKKELGDDSDDSSKEQTSSSDDPIAEITGSASTSSSVSSSVSSLDASTDNSTDTSIDSTRTTVQDSSDKTEPSQPASSTNTNEAAETEPEKTQGWN